MTDQLPDRAEQAARDWFADQAAAVPAVGLRSAAAHPATTGRSAPPPAAANLPSISPEAVRAAFDRRQRRRFVGLLAAAAVLVAALAITPMALRPADPPITGIPAPSAEPAWETTAPPPLSPRSGSLTAWLNGQFYIIGGWDGGPCPPGAACDMVPPDLRDGARYDPETDTWTPIAEAPLGVGVLASNRGYFTMAATSDSIVVAGGENGSRQVWAYQAATDSWQQRADLPAEGQLVATSTTVVLSTYGNSDPARYAYTGDSWAPLPTGPLDTCQSWRTLADADRLVVLARCGEGGAEMRTSFFDPATEAWSDPAVVPGITAEETSQYVGGVPVLVAGKLVWPNWLSMLSSTRGRGIYDLETRTWLDASADAAPGGLSFRGMQTEVVHPVFEAHGLVEANGHLLDVRDASWRTVPEAPVLDRWDPVVAVGPDALLSCFGYLYTRDSTRGVFADGCHLLTVGPATTQLPTAVPTGPATSGGEETMARLTEHARETALAHGRGRTPITAEAVATRASLAEQVLHENANPPKAEADVWVVQLHGQFVCALCSRPPGADAPAGTVIQLVIPADGAVEGSSFGLTRTPADLSQLGDVVHLELGTLDLPPFDDPDPDVTALADTVRPLLAGIAHDDPVSAEAGATTLGRAQQLIVGHTPYPPSDTPAWFVQLQGRFACADCTVLGTATARQADVLILVLDQATGEQLMAAVSNDRFDLAEFGELSYLDPRALSTAPDWQPGFAGHPRSAQPGSGEGETAALDGVLRITGGCLVVESDAGPVYVPVLPTPGSAWSAMDRTLEVDGVGVREGGRVSWGGGYFAKPLDDWSVPDACRGIGQEYFRFARR